MNFIRSIIVVGGLWPAISYAQYTPGQKDTAMITYERHLNDYHSGVRDPAVMPSLAEKALSLKDTAIANMVARDYLGYLVAIQDGVLYSKDNVTFLCYFPGLIKEAKQILDIILKHGPAIDSVMNSPGLGQRLKDAVLTVHINSLVSKENSTIKPEEPDWNTIARKLKPIYGKGSVERNVIEARLVWYQAHQLWRLYGKLTVKKIIKYGPDTAGIARVIFNNMAWVYFVVHDQDIHDSQRIAFYLGQLAARHPDHIGLLDTYACLLYKIGKVNQALRMEEDALRRSNQRKDIKANYEKMKMGEKING